MSFSHFLQYDSRTGRDVQLQPFLTIPHIEWIIVGQVCDAVIGKAITTKFLGISIQHHLVRARRHEEAIVRIAACG